MTTNALIVGTGPGLSAALVQLFTKEGMSVSVTARDTQKLKGLCVETGATAYSCDASDPQAVEELFGKLDELEKQPDLVVYNAGAYTRGAITELDADAVKEVLMGNAFGAMLIAREAVKRMQTKGAGTLLFTGASAGVKGYANSSAFAMGKFALRGLCQSLARELFPQNIHVAHFVIDGSIYQPGRGAPYDDPERTLHPERLAETYLSVANQHPSAWSWEMELRPFSETF